MPVVKIDLWKGREKETKKELIEKITSTVVDVIDCPSDKKNIKNNMNIRGIL